MTAGHEVRESTSVSSVKEVGLLQPLLGHFLQDVFFFFFWWGKTSQGRAAVTPAICVSIQAKRN